MRSLGYVLIGLGILAGGCLLAAALNEALAIYDIAPRTALGMAVAALYGALLKPLTLLTALVLRPKSVPAAVAAVAFTLVLCGVEWMATAPDWIFQAWPVLSLSAAFLPAVGAAVLRDATPERPNALVSFVADLQSLAQQQAEGITIHDDRNGFTASQAAIAEALGVSLGTVNSRLQNLDAAGLITKDTDGRCTSIRFIEARRQLRLVR